MWECVIFLYQHKVSRCESAADLVHFSSSAIKATMLQCSMLHPIVQSKRCGTEGFSLATSSRAPVLMRVNRAVSIATNMHHTAASHVPAKQLYLSVQRQLRPENVLYLDSTATSMVHFSSDWTF